MSRMELQHAFEQGAATTRFERAPLWQAYPQSAQSITHSLFADPVFDWGSLGDIIANGDRSLIEVREDTLAGRFKVRRDLPTDRTDVPMSTLVPAFIISELKQAFIIGFIVFIPFLVIDIVVSGALMALGMMMMPPVMVSLPFKLLLFVLVDGWALVIQSLVSSYG